MVHRGFTDGIVNLNEEVERFASFDHATRRFIAYSIWLVPELRPLVNTSAGTAGNIAAPFMMTDQEARERAQAHRLMPALRACTAKGEEGRRDRRLNFWALLELAKVDLHWKRLTTLPAFIFCYERTTGPAWRELLPLAWREAALSRRRRKPAPQLPLDARLRDDASVPSHLEDDPAPWFFPSLDEADAIGGAPLLAGL
jgi:hypothetical protein